MATVLRLPDASGSFASTPDNAAIDVVGDIDIRAKIQPVTWTPATTSDCITAKWTSGDLSWLFRITVTTGVLALAHTENGSTAVTISSTVATGFQPDTPHWVRVTMDVDNGASGYDTIFYTSEDGSSWAQLGTTVTTATATSIYSGAAILEVGTSSAGTANFFNGLIHKVEVRSGIGGSVVANPDFTLQAAGATSFTDAAGRPWTINGAAQISSHMGVPGNVGRYIQVGNGMSRSEWAS